MENPVQQRQDRTRLFVYPYFQKHFIAYTAGIGFGVVATFYLSQTYFFWRLYQQGKNIGLPAGHAFFQFLDGERFVSDILFVGASIIVLGIITFQGLRMSHKIAGPMFNLERYLQQWKKGERDKPLRFRNTDYFQEIAVLIDECLNDKAAAEVETKTTSAKTNRAA